MNTPLDKETLLSILSSLDKKALYFGPQGFELANTETSLMHAQHGFSLKPDNTPLASEEAANWQGNWLVIATDTELGDPYFIDVEQAHLPVYTAMITDNNWQAQPVANSLANFMQCLQCLANASKQTQAQFIPEETTISDQRTLTSLKSKLIKLSKCEHFWSLFFDCYADWLSDVDLEDDD